MANLIPGCKPVLRKGSNPVLPLAHFAREGDFRNPVAASMPVCSANGAPVSLRLQPHEPTEAMGRDLPAGPGGCDGAGFCP